MDLETVDKATKGIPHMLPADARELTSFILDNQLFRILELGFCHGVSTSYFAAALDSAGQGHITTVDLESARSNTPNIDHLLNALGLRTHVTVFYEPTSYVWRLMLMLREQPIPQFDFCYVDGAHNWFTDGFAFLLVDKLLRPGGWIVFDDLDWTYASSPTLRDTPLVHAMPDAEKNATQVRQVYELLVKTHPAYDNFLIKNGRAYARKSPESSSQAPPLVRQEVVYVQEHVGLGAIVSKIVKRLIRR
jgi:predicted O-methyltransferase YrrM